MKDCRQFYIDGKWVAPTKANDLAVTNPATEETIATISLGSACCSRLSGPRRAHLLHPRHGALRLRRPGGGAPAGDPRALHLRRVLELPARR